MPWPKQVREDILVASGRRCALCTVFVGTRLELHHIQPEADGGPSTFENGIPVCFNCHADVGHYDPTHPRGNRYTPEELRRHRDRLYQQVANGVLAPAAPSPPPPTVAEADRSLFKTIKDALPPATVGRFLQDQNFAGQFEVGPWGAISDYMDRAEDPDYGFIDPELERLRSALNEALRQLLKAGDGRVYSTGRWLGVPDEWAEPSHIRYRDYWPTVEKLDQLARRASEAFKALIREGRVRLDVP